ncbi:hypothetical protein FXE12_10980 [Lactobacillus sp. SL9-6]|nr:hypothetical protein FXE12_10980 [Lactobacillus sp. SL9-6]
MMVPKFRAYIKDLDEFDYNDVPHKGHFVYGNLIKGKPNDNVDAIVGDLIEINDEYINPEWWCSVEKGSAEQSTGLKDANGKEIYEGDILEYYYETHGQTFYDPDTLGAVGGEPGIETTVIGKVAIWPSTGVVLTRIKAEYPEDFDSSNLDVPKMLHVNKRFTILGNVHENPELLEAQHD